MMNYIYNGHGKAVGYIRDKYVHSMHGNAVGQINGTHVHKLNGSYVGELHKDMIVNKHIGNPGNRGSVDYGYPDISGSLLDD